MYIDRESHIDLDGLDRGIRLALGIVEDNGYCWGLHNFGSSLSPKERIKEDLIRDLKCQIESLLEDLEKNSGRYLNLEDV